MNKQVFDLDSIETVIDFVDTLLWQGSFEDDDDNEYYMNDVHVYRDGGKFIVEWLEHVNERTDDKFVLVNENTEAVLNKIELPNGEYVLAEKGVDKQKVLDDYYASINATAEPTEPEEVEPDKTTKSDVAEEDVYLVDEDDN